jgi:hypothetical protein
MRVLRDTVLCAALAFALVVASADPAHAAAPAAAKGRIDPCDLLTRRDIHRITRWKMPLGTHATELRRKGQSICNYTEPRHAGAVQVQLHEGAGKRAFVKRRAAAERLALGRGETVDVRGARAAFEIPDHGVVGLLDEGHFVQVVTIGVGVRDRQQRLMAAVVAKRLR